MVKDIKLIIALESIKALMSCESPIEQGIMKLPGSFSLGKSLCWGALDSSNIVIVSFSSYFLFLVNIRSKTWHSLEFARLLQWNEY